MKRSTFLRRMLGGAAAVAVGVPLLEEAKATVWAPTPVRYYTRMAIDNNIEASARTNPGAFEDLSDRIFEKLWDAWADMESRHTLG